MPRGGARNGTPGTSYGARTDLNVAKLPTVAAPGQVYGEAGRQISSQQQMPMGAQPTPNAGPASPEQPGITPGSLGDLLAPTQRPNEPMTHGAAGGLGPGPESLPGNNPTANAFATGKDLINSLANTNPGNAALSYLAAHASGSL